MSRLVIRVSRLVLTLFSYPAYEWTTYQSPGANRSDWRSAATGSSSGSTVATAVLAGVAAWAAPASADSSTSLASSVLPAISSYSGTSSLPYCLLLGGAENVRDDPGEHPVQRGDHGQHDRYENDHDGRVRQQLLTGRPDHLTEFGDDLPQKPEKSAENSDPIIG